MDDVVFITGNQHKADYVSRYLGKPVEHIKLDLDEIQSLDVHEITRHKLHQAYEKVQRPVMVEDVGLAFHAFGKLPGPFIKWFIEEIGPEKICRLLDTKDRGATVVCVVGYYDGTDEQYFQGSATGRIADSPAEGKGYGFDSFFINDGFEVTRSMMNEEDHDRTYFEIKPFGKLKAYLETKKSA